MLLKNKIFHFHYTQRICDIISGDPWCPHHQVHHRWNFSHHNDSGFYWWVKGIFFRRKIRKLKKKQNHNNKSRTNLVPKKKKFIKNRIKPIPVEIEFECFCCFSLLKWFLSVCVFDFFFFFFWIIINH